ncbi:DUF4231 domain-containing protein [Inquilinus sp. CA228]|uniref:DUF4231 domain-containing protein n=1 Tax=Inquilinus sp. CA228 TaxID=3455609 RepID=UPI003F8D6CC0
MPDDNGSDLKLDLDLLAEDIGFARKAYRNSRRRFYRINYSLQICLLTFGALTTAMGGYADSSETISTIITIIGVLTTLATGLLSLFSYQKRLMSTQVSLFGLTELQGEVEWARRSTTRSATITATSIADWQTRLAVILRADADSYLKAMFQDATGKSGPRNP